MIQIELDKVKDLLFVDTDGELEDIAHEIYAISHIIYNEIRRQNKEAAELFSALLELEYFDKSSPFFKDLKDELEHADD